MGKKKIENKLCKLCNTTNLEEARSQWSYEIGNYQYFTGDELDKMQELRENDKKIEDLKPNPTKIERLLFEQKNCFCGQPGKHFYLLTNRISQKTILIGSTCLDIILNSDVYKPEPKKRKNKLTKMKFSNNHDGNYKIMKELRIKYDLDRLNMLHYPEKKADPEMKNRLFLSLEKLTIEKKRGKMKNDKIIINKILFKKFKEAYEKYGTDFHIPEFLFLAMLSYAMKEKKSMMDLIYTMFYSPMIYMAKYDYFYKCQDLKFLSQILSYDILFKINKDDQNIDLNYFRKELIKLSDHKYFQNARCEIFQDIKDKKIPFQLDEVFVDNNCCKRSSIKIFYPFLLQEYGFIDVEKVIKDKNKQRRNKKKQLSKTIQKYSLLQ